MHPQKPIALSRTDSNLIVMLGYVLTHTPKTHSAVAGLKKRQMLLDGSTAFYRGKEMVMINY